MKLVRYDAACRAIAEAKSIDEVKQIRDIAIAMAAYARQARNKDMEADAIEIRMRATRGVDRLIKEQAMTVGLSAGTRGSPVKGARVDEKPTLTEAGIDKNLAHQARSLGKLTDKQFEEAVAAARDAVSHVVRMVMRAADNGQGRTGYDAEVAEGCKVEDLDALIRAGRKFAVIYADPPWTFKVYSGKGKRRSADRHYATQSLEDIKALSVSKLATDNCALFLWCVSPELPGALDVIRAWGFEFKTIAFVWVKTNENDRFIDIKGSGLHWGMGYWTRANVEMCLLATRGAPKRQAMDVHQVVVSPVSEHSRKPDEVQARIERLLPGPYLELYARRSVDKWTAWGNQITSSLFHQHIKAITEDERV